MAQDVTPGRLANARAAVTTSPQAGEQRLGPRHPARRGWVAQTQRLPLCAGGRGCLGVVFTGLGSLHDARRPAFGSPVRQLGPLRVAQKFRRACLRDLGSAGSLRPGQAAAARTLSYGTALPASSLGVPPCPVAAKPSTASGAQNPLPELDLRGPGSILTSSVTF